jgi:hypothetical protein
MADRLGPGLQWAVQAITQLRSDLDQLEPHVTTDPGQAVGDGAERDGVPVAVCPHPYERELSRWLPKVRLSTAFHPTDSLRS